MKYSVTAEISYENDLYILKVKETQRVYRSLTLTGSQ